MERKVVVSILSRNRLLRESLARILSKKQDFEVSASASIPIVGARPLPPKDVWVSDSLQCLIENGLPRPHEQKDRVQGKCVLVAMQEDVSQFLEAVRMGVLGYVLQEASAADVIGAIRSASQGEAVCPGKLTRVLFDFVSSQKNNPHSLRARKQFQLTRRERQLVPLVGRGLTNKEIAAELSVSEQTVKSHIHRMLRKVGVEDRFAISDACQEEQLSA